MSDETSEMVQAALARAAAGARSDAAVAAARDQTPVLGPDDDDAYGDALIRDAFHPVTP